VPILAQQGWDSSTAGFKSHEARVPGWQILRSKGGIPALLVLKGAKRVCHDRQPVLALFLSV
jgi:hypothetical protein